VLAESSSSPSVKLYYARIEREIPRTGFEILDREGFPFLLSRELFIQQRLSLGQELDEQEFFRLRDLQAHFECREQALRYLAGREHTRSELVLKLRKKGHEGDVIGTVLDALAGEGLLNEYRYALLWAESRLKKRPEGRFLMAQRLAAKRVNRNDMEKALDELYSEEQTKEYVLHAHEQGLAKVEPAMIRQWLRQRGFSSYDLQIALDE
jgi:regulatory protein